MLSHCDSSKGEIEMRFGYRPLFTSKQALALICSIMYCVAAIAGASLGLFMQFLVLSHIHATQLMWFLYWCSVPIALGITILSNFILKIAKAAE